MEENKKSFDGGDQYIFPSIQKQSGCGCAAAVINGMLGRNGGECCCGPQTDGAGSLKGGGACCS